MPRSYIGIDQSYSGCAIVAFTPATKTATEHVYDFSPSKAGVGPQRLAYVHHTLRQLFVNLRQQGTVSQVCFEGYAYGSKFRREELGELGGVMRLALVQVFPPHLLHAVAPTTVKKYVTGSGRADKDKMMLAVYMRWQHESSSHDAADAYSLARIAADLETEKPLELKFQQDVIDAIRNPKPPTKKAA
ncbi:crossover junction endodeoxyribonuclease RuvC [Actinacidiphila sp. ITFR-21]|uniref:crossover junction endodeoxyribonuclease RuvC n=1 Tax=Actinacidiphila sp. ITFR-21 TaxID=3075199 RepID=UPI00288B7CAD|nr:crossover junction endodeoxyribonuclease RuvC [Streptomyces sp. ITFR-21]WNI17585.1 crossover junction endodeoxyribonuclease RuvC [Streptomyces sp. ITFR-21]WNI17725.1 crossover junction endodeoxyribonuclease RuvC [Streptomyces sp. ITFR-21]